METEYGSVYPTRFAQGKLYSAENEEILCKCGQPAETAIIGKEAYLGRCNKCMGYEESSYKLVYKPPNEKQ